jgi:hypothetical protein
MLKLNESDRCEVGNSINCNQLVNASLHKYLKRNNESQPDNIETNVKLYQIKC